MGYNIYNADGSLFASGGFGSGSGSGGSGSSLTYDRMDVGILSLQQLMQSFDIYDFRVPGDANKRTFQYKFPRSGFVLGASVTGTVTVSILGGLYVTKSSNGTTSDVMSPADAGNTMTYDVTNFPNNGCIINAPTPIPFAAGELASAKFKNLAGTAVTVNLAGFLIIGLAPQ